MFCSRCWLPCLRVLEFLCGWAFIQYILSYCLLLQSLYSRLFPCKICILFHIELFHSRFSTTLEMNDTQKEDIKTLEKNEWKSRNHLHIQVCSSVKRWFYSFSKYKLGIFVNTLYESNNENSWSFNHPAPWCNQQKFHFHHWTYNILKLKSKFFLHYMHCVYNWTGFNANLLKYFSTFS